jgi:hypothetical protein
MSRETGIFDIDYDFDNTLNNFLRFRLLILLISLVRTPYLLKLNIFWRVSLILVVQDIEIQFDMTTRQIVTVFGCLKAAHAHNFILAIAIDMSLIEYRIILRHHIMIPLFPNDKVCCIS